MGVDDGGGAPVGDHASGADMGPGGEDADLDAGLSTKFLCFIQAPEILLKVVAMTKGCSTHPREEYWAEERIQVKTTSPEQRLENGIKTSY